MSVRFRGNLSFFAAVGAAVFCFAFTVLVAAPRIGGAADRLLRKVSSLIPTARTEEPETAGVRRETARTDVSFETPPDVMRMQADYLASHRNVPAAGTVKERFYTDDGATDLVEGLAVKNGTSALHPDFKALLEAGPPLSPPQPGPLVLVFHTHTTESYLPAYNGVFYSDFATRSDMPDRNMVRVGDAICDALEQNGVAFIHDTEIYDGSYTGAYARSRAAVLSWLSQYPSIRIVLDVHRDAIYESDTVAVKPTAEIGGRKAAQIMILAGAETDGVADFPDWEDNLRFALCLQQKAEALYPGLLRPLYFCPRKYNMDVVPCGLLLEIGSDTNTLEEAVYAGALMGRALSALINDAGKTKN